MLRTSASGRSSLRRYAPLALAARLALPVALGLSIVAGPAIARAAEADRIVLVVDGSISGVADEALRAAIAAELGVDVALAGPGVEGRGTVRVRLEPGKATITFTTPPAEGGTEAGKTVERTIELPAKIEVAVETIALLVGNLVRDEAAALIAQLTVKVEVKTEPPKGATTEPAKPAPAPEPAALPPPPAAPKIAPMPCRTPFGPIPWALDFAPYVGTSTVPAAQRSVRFVSVGTVGTIGRAVRGVQVSGAVSVTTATVCGATISGAVDVVAGSVHGAQIAGAVGLASDVHGGQISGAAGFARDVRGAQVGGAFVAARDLLGVQVAPVNVARDLKGAQIGVVNVARDVKGVQIGVVNVARDADAPIGLFSFVANGPTHFDAFGTESGLFAATVVHGGRRVHNVYGVGGRVGPAGTRGAIVLGIGGRIVSSDGLDLDLDAVAWGLRRNFTGDARWSILSQIRLLAAVRVVEGISVLAGPAWNVLTTNDPEERTQAPFGATRYDDGRDAWSVRGWPGVVLGLRAF